MKVLRILVVSILFLSTGCITTTDQFGGEVVERSRMQPPAWTSLSAGQLHESDGLYKYVEIQTRLPDLPSGIKNTQLDAMIASKDALAANIRSRLFQYAEKEKILMHGPMAELDRHLGESTQVVHGKYAKVADIYFEKLKSPDESTGITEYYRAHILVQFPKSHLGELYDDFANRLTRANDASLKALGKVVKEMDQTAITH